MHKLESFAVSCGSKIHSPIIEQSFYPIVERKYICVSQYHTNESKKYDYYNDVIFHIKDFLLENNIKIVEINKSPCRPLFYTKPHLNINHLHASYIINKSLMYFGNDSLYSHIASHFNKKIVCPINTCYYSLEKPYWSQDENIKILQQPSNLKPSFNDNESPKTINDVPPESIASGILDSLNIKHKLNKISTIHIGELYHIKGLDIIPGNYDPRRIALDCVPNIRMDKVYSLDFLSLCKDIDKFSIITDKLIDQNVIKLIKSKISGITFFINDKTKIEDVNFMQSHGIPLNLLTKQKSDLQDLRLKFLDFNIKEYDLNMPESFKLKNEKNLKFLSNRNVISEGQVYNSYYSLGLQKNSFSLDNIEDFTEDFHFCRIFDEKS